MSSSPTRSLTCGGRSAATPTTPGCTSSWTNSWRPARRFARLWAERTVNTAGAGRKTISHPEVGPITLDCDVLTVAGCDLRLVVYTAEPSSRDAEQLRLVRIIGLQKLSVQDGPG